MFLQQDLGETEELLELLVLKYFKYGLFNEQNFLLTKIFTNTDIIRYFKQFRFTLFCALVLNSFST